MKKKPQKCKICKKHGHTKDWCFQKLAKGQSKEHANLIVEQSEEDEDEAGLEEKTLSVAVSDVSRDDEIDDHWAWSPPKMMY